MKKLTLILPLALILCFIIGCQDKEAMAELEEFRAQAEVEEQNKAIFRQFTEELNKGNLEFGREICAPEFAYYEPSGATEPKSLEETIEAFKMHLQVFPDLHIEIQELVAKGDKLIARSSITGTHTGEGLGIPATGNKIKLSAIEIWQMKNGKGLVAWSDSDILGLMMQLGMELKPKEDK